VEPGAGESAGLDAERCAARRLELQDLLRRSQEARARARATREQVRRGRSRREVLHDSAFARLQARLESMPVIEQAKGIIMAQQRCGPEDAFDLLRQTSQRINVKLSELAEQIVEQVAFGSNGDTVTPLTLGATRCLPSRSGTRHAPIR
jgi:hypothetical protein